MMQAFTSADCTSERLCHEGCLVGFFFTIFISHAKNDKTIFCYFRTKTLDKAGIFIKKQKKLSK